MGDEQRFHARIGTVMLVLMTWGGLAVSWGTQYQKTENLAERIAEDRIEMGRLRGEIQAMKEKSELPARLEERMKALETQMARNNGLVDKLVDRRTR